MGNSLPESLVPTTVWWIFLPYSFVAFYDMQSKQAHYSKADEVTVVVVVDIEDQKKKTEKKKSG